MMIDETLRRTGYSAGQAYGIKNALFEMGIDDYLETNLKAGMSVDEVGGVFSNVFKQTEEQLNEWHKLGRTKKLEEAAAIGGKEGALGATIPLDEVMNLRTDQRLMDWRNWDFVWEHRKDPVFHVLYEQMVNSTGGSYRRMEQKVQDVYTGLVKAFGVETEYGSFFARNVGDDFKLWKNFFDTKYKKTRAFFKAQKDGKWDDVGWEQLNDELGVLYNKSYYTIVCRYLQSATPR